MHSYTATKALCYAPSTSTGGPVIVMKWVSAGCDALESEKVQNINLGCDTDNCMEHGLTWYIDDFLVHIQKSILRFFTSLTQCINLQEKLENND